MEKKKKATIILGIIVVLLLSAVIPAFALLIHDTNIDFSTEFGEIPEEALNFTSNTSNTFTFREAGDKVDMIFSVKNNASYPMQYFFDIVLGQASNGLEKAIFVYIDQKYICTLAQAITGVNIAQEDMMLLAKTSEAADSRVHTLTLELHNGADGGALATNSFKLNLSMTARTIGYQDHSMVSNASEFFQAISEVNRGATGRTIRLINDITLDKSLTISRSAKIDLMVSAINFAGYTMAIVDDGIIDNHSLIYSSRGEIATTVGRPIIINGLKSRLTLGYGCYKLATNVAVTKCDTSAIQLQARASAQTALQHGITANTVVELLLGMEHYYVTGALKITKISGEFTLEQSRITSLVITKTAVAEIMIGTLPLQFKVLGMDAQGYSQIVVNRLSYLNSATIDNSDSDVDYDLYLPSSIPDINATLEWVSLNPEILSSDGICGDSVEGMATLIAYVHINGDTIAISFTFTVLKQTNQMRFDYLVARIGEKELSAIYGATNPDGSYFILPIVDQNSEEDYRQMYSMRSIGLETLNYELSPTYRFLSTLGVDNRVHMIDYTLERFAEMRIVGLFSNEREIKYEAVISINIKTVDNESLHTQILDYLQAQLNKVDILANVLRTRASDGMANERGDFFLPASYKGYNILYASSDLLINKITTQGSVDNNDHLSLFALDLNHLRTLEASIIITVTISIDNNEAGGIVTENQIFFKSPAALKREGDSMLTDSIFFSTQLQVFEQLKDEFGVLEAGVPTLTQKVDDTLISIQKDYILMRDALKLRRLVIKTGNREYGNSAGELVYHADSGLLIYNINVMSGIPNGLRLIKGLEWLILDNDAELFQLNGSMSATRQGENFLTMAVDNYTGLTRLEMINCYLVDTSKSATLAHLTHINFSKNTLASEWDYLASKVSNRLDYLDLTNTGYDFSMSEGLLVALYYRHTVLQGRLVPSYYYTLNSERKLFVQRYTSLGMEMRFHLYRLAVTKSTISSKSMQLAWQVLGTSQGNKPLDYRVTNPINQSGSVILAAEIVRNTATAKVRLDNKILGTTLSGRPATERVILIVSISYTETDNSTQVISRNVILNLAYKAG